MQQEGRIVTDNWDLYDTRHVVFRPTRRQLEALKEGYDWASASATDGLPSLALPCTMGPLSTRPNTSSMPLVGGSSALWDLFIRARQLAHITPLLEKHPFSHQPLTRAAPTSRRAGDGSCPIFFAPDSFVTDLRFRPT